LKIEGLSMKIVSLKDIAATTTSHNKVGLKKQMIAPGAIPHLVQFMQAIIKPGEVVSEHKHDDLYEIFFVEEGIGVIRIDGKKYKMEKGKCITVEPKEQHEVANMGEEELILTIFSIKV